MSYNLSPAIPFHENDIRRKIIRRSVIASIFDHVIFGLITALIFEYLTWPAQEPVSNVDSISPFEINIITSHEDEKRFYAILLIFLAANISLILSKGKATLGMMLARVQVHSDHESRPAPLQAIKLFLLSPTLLSLHTYTLYIFMAETPMDLYRSVNAQIIFIFGLFAILIIAYISVFGSVLDARKKMTGLTTSLHPAYAAKLQRKILKKGMASQRWFWPSVYIGRAFMAISLAAMLFFSMLVALDLFKRPSFEQEIYAPYDVNWGNDNAYFALEGLNAPAEVDNFYEYGRNVAYQSFVKIEALKKAAHIPYSFSSPPSENFKAIPSDDRLLEFKKLWADKSELACFATLENNPDIPCASKDDVKQAIAENALLWARFNKMPDYADFSVPPQRMGGNFKGKDIIPLSFIKASDIIMMQMDGHSSQALDEWIRFMRLYRQMTMAKNSTVEKALFMILHARHASILETLLHNDPDLARTRFDDIRRALNPGGVKMFRGETMMADDYVVTEPEILQKTGKSTGIRNKFYKCIQAHEKIAGLSALSYFDTQGISSFCPALHKDTMIDLLIEASLKTTGNPVTNTIWSLMYGGVMKGTDALIANMHITDAKFRIALLGAEILRGDIPVEGVAAFVQAAPKELQNPLNEKPFQWDESGHYLWFVSPQDGSIIHKFRLNLSPQ